MGRPRRRRARARRRGRRSAAARRLRRAADRDPRLGRSRAARPGGDRAAVRAATGSATATGARCGSTAWRRPRSATRRWPAGFLGAAVSCLRADGRLALLAQALILRAWSGFHLGRGPASEADLEEGERLALETVAAAVGGAGARRPGGVRRPARRRSTRPRRSPPRSSASRFLAASAALADASTRAASPRWAPAATPTPTTTCAGMFDPPIRPSTPCIAYGRSATSPRPRCTAGTRRGARADARPGAATRRARPRPRIHVAVRHARARARLRDDAEAALPAALAADLTAGRSRAPGCSSRYGDVAAPPAPRGRVARAAARGARAVRRPGPARRGASARARNCAPRARPAAAAQPTRATSSPRRNCRSRRWRRDGLSNREIGQRLYLSHRTVGSHLYRIFPKLGITSRGELRAALETAA